MDTPVLRPLATPANHSTVGRPRVLTPTQLTAVIEWQRTRKTARQLAHELGISIGTLINSVQRPDLPHGLRLRGKQRILTDEKLATARKWYRTRRTSRQRAAELGITHTQFESALRNHPFYKAPPPEQHLNALRARHALIQNLEHRGLT